MPPTIGTKSACATRKKSPCATSCTKQATPSKNGSAFRWVRSPSKASHATAIARSNPVKSRRSASPPSPSPAQLSLRAKSSSPFPIVGAALAPPGEPRPRSRSARHATTRRHPVAAVASQAAGLSARHFDPSCKLQSTEFRISIFHFRISAIPMPAERLQKIIAAAGIASRRKAEELISAGRVTLNGAVVTEQGTKADPAQDKIAIDGQPIAAKESLQYFALYKPKGYVTTVTDPEGRPTVMDLVKKIPARLYPVGRLDYGSEGLLLMTNDGALAQKLTKAGSHVPKTYLVKISGKPAKTDIACLRAGVTIELADGRRVKTSPASIQLVENAPNPWYEVVLIEGRNRQIRRMFAVVGFHVEKIKRTKIGPLKLDLEPGEFRALTVREVAQLKAL